MSDRGLQSCRRPRIGVGVLVRNADGRILLGKRKGSHGDGCWQFPGGHLEFGESVFDCAVREVFEECGIAISNLRIGPFTEDHFDEGLHYVTLYVLADLETGVPVVKEPEKCAAWGWFDDTDLPSPHFLPIDNLLKRFGSLAVLSEMEEG